MENKKWPRRSPREILETHVHEESSIHAILRNIERERTAARTALNLPPDDGEDHRWTEAFSIIISKDKSDAEKAIELKQKFIILQR